MAQIGQTTYPSDAETGEGPYYGSVSVKDPDYQSKMQNQDDELSRMGVQTIHTNPLIHKSFPTQGKVKRAHEGSQSDAPGKYD